MNFFSSEFISGTHVPKIKGRKMFPIATWKQFKTHVLHLYLFAFLCSRVANRRNARQGNGPQL
jgi:hypothetical protein